MQSLNELVNQWKTEAVALLLPENEEAIRGVFAGLGVDVTSDMIGLYKTVGGMDMMDNEYWRLWSLAEIKEENTTASKHGVIFSDYLIGCWCYRLKPMTDQTSAVYVDYFDGNEPVLVASTLKQFFDAYLVNARHVLETRSEKRNDA
jgi:hypothetical protein